jgi:glycosyltransferase involved in cell wall biosynthesis
VLGAGRVWDAAKNLTALASIARDLAWPVRIAGAGKSADGAAAGVELVDGVTWLGELSHASLLCEMREAEIFCSPARYEPFGLSVLEAASAGCALVLSDICSFRELWDGAALFVPPDDRQALARALISLSDNDDLRARLQHDARQRSLRYSLAQTAAQYHGLYTALIDRRLNAGAVGMPLELSA